MRRRFIMLLMLALPFCALGSNKIYSSQIKSLQAVVNQDWISHPAVMKLGSMDVLHIAFDELSHDYHRYIYRLEHCEADWSKSEDIFESDWLEGFNDNTIDNYDCSINTILEYTHYSFHIPNDRCRLKMSGNYRIYIIDEDTNSDEPVAMVEFMVTEQLMGIQMSATTNTDIDTNNSHQQLSITLNYGNTLVTNPSEQIHCKVMQNGRDDNMVVNPKPDYTNANGLEWSHNKSLIFDAGNEYHKFEVLDVSHPTMGIETIRWDGASYQAYPFVTEPRYNYIYDEVAKGAFYIRNSNNKENDITSEYVWVNYRMHIPKLSDGTIIINGQWTTDDYLFNYMMEYDEELGMYTCKILQKQGYYSYQCLWQRGDGTITLLPSEGSYYQTENYYQSFIYYKGTSERTWRLTAYRTLQLK